MLNIYKYTTGDIASISDCVEIDLNGCLIIYFNILVSQHNSPPPSVLFFSAFFKLRQFWVEVVLNEAVCDTKTRKKYINICLYMCVERDRKRERELELGFSTPGFHGTSSILNE